MRNEFLAAIDKHQSTFGLDLPSVTTGLLADYYQLVHAHNPLLHLVGPCSPEEFATRHILESLTLLEYLPHNSLFADVGAGAGLPSIPCLIARPDLRGVLIESKEKKARFLEAAVSELGLAERAEIANKQFEEVSLDTGSRITCRALDKFIDRLPRLLKWSGKRRGLFFGGPSLSEALDNNGVKHEKRLMPLSEKRYLFITK